MIGNMNEYNLRQELIERKIVDVIVGGNGLIMKLDNGKRLLVQRECIDEDCDKCELYMKIIY